MAELGKMLRKEKNLPSSTIYKFSKFLSGGAFDALRGEITQCLRKIREAVELVINKMLPMQA